ncbi:hypothetical protein EJ06DRAFT_241161 [Trichodelitschia bisporula]|uniref:Uncharacterized protein n=1 Tax=Trichodelitschia bisporula TaxID=703511 RepID=A0A6G1HL17_9PEZI|nr:hypothetical protein EJ06DRAFT_241161 [Trichodelitschia bisporula]
MHCDFRFLARLEISSFATLALSAGPSSLRTEYAPWFHSFGPVASSSISAPRRNLGSTPKLQLHRRLIFFYTNSETESVPWYSSSWPVA